jgi:hypothetical protein
VVHGHLLNPFLIDEEVRERMALNYKTFKNTSALFIAFPKDI